MSDRVHDGGTAGQGLPRWVVDRPAALDELDRAAESPIVLVAGAPGSGKTVLVAQWLERLGAPAAWVRFRDVDATPTREGARIVESIAALAPERIERLGPADLAEPTFRARLVELIGEVSERMPGGLRVVLDDVHRLGDGPSRAALGRLVDELTVPVVVLSRSDPSWPLSRWRLEGRLGELRQPSLDLDDPSALTLLGRIAPGRLSEPQAKEIVARCGGWAAALVLAGHSARIHPDPETFVRDFSGAQRGVADYLFDEVYAALDEGDRWLLLATSVCVRFNAELAAELSGLADAEARVHDLFGRFMLMAPDRDRAGWFHYHDLLTDMLRQQLTIERPDQREPLLRAAAAWHERHGDLNAQCTYLAAIEDWPAIAAAARSAGRLGFKRRSHEQVIRSLELIPEREWDPPTALMLASFYLTNGQHWRVDDMLERVRSHPDAGPQHLLHANGVVVAGIEWDRPPEVALVAADRGLAAVDALADGDVFTVVSPADVAPIRQILLATQARSRDLLADEAGARADYRKAHESGADPIWTVYALAGHALVEARGANHARAIGLARRAIAGAEDLDMGDEPVAANAHLALALVDADRGGGSVSAHLDAARARCVRNNRWMTLAEERIQRAALHRRDGDPPAAVACLDELGVMAALPPLLASDAAAVSALLLVDSGRLDDASAVLAGASVTTRFVRAAGSSLAEARRRAAGTALVEPLTARELEILAAMTSHRTSAQIAADLVVSVHTVKTHQRHIYRKLAVANRSEAVAAAERLGLLTR